MHISSFVNNPDDVSPHSNEYGAGTVSSQSFIQRQATEKQRQTIQGYQYSRLGANFLDRRQTPRIPTREKLNRDTNGDGITSRQSSNARAAAHTPARSVHRFQEPQSRGYNPYA